MLDWGTVFQQLNQRVPPLLVSEFFRQLVCQGLLRVECFRRFFCILHDLGRIGVTYDGVDRPPLGICKHQRGESGDAVGFFIGFQRSFCLRVLLLFTWVVQFHGNKGTGNGVWISGRERACFFCMMQAPHQSEPVNSSITPLF